MRNYLTWNIWKLSHSFNLIYSCKIWNILTCFNCFHLILFNLVCKKCAVLKNLLNYKNFDKNKFYFNWKTKKFCKFPKINTIANNATVIFAFFCYSKNIWKSLKLSPQNQNFINNEFVVLGIFILSRLQPKNLLDFLYHNKSNRWYCDKKSIKPPFWCFYFELDVN